VALAEGERIEFKREVTDDITKTVIAFANSGGGTIYIGLEDQGDVLGIDDVDSELNRVSNMVRDRIRPDLTMFVHYERRGMEGKAVIVVEVSQGSERPYYLHDKGLKPSGVYVRQGESSAPASVNAIRRMIKETDGDQYEGMRSMNQELTFEYARMEFAKREVAFGESQMVTLGLMAGSERLYTNAALLLSDQCPHTVKVAKFQGITKDVFTDRQEFSGSVLKQLNEVYHYIDMNNQTHAQISGLYRTDRKDYPEIAVREALLNALVHREYAMSSSILVSIFDDRIEIVSVGGLVNGLTLKDILFGVSMPRNESLAGIFYRLKLIEAYGTGMAKIMGAYQGLLMKPEIQVSDNALRVMLPNRNRKSITEGLSVKESAVMYQFEKSEKITRKDVEEVLGVSQTMAGRVLRQLVDKERVETNGAGPSRTYSRRK
jgi:ATP-dependent DNA helicase RecG